MGEGIPTQLDGLNFSFHDVSLDGLIDRAGCGRGYAEPVDGLDFTCHDVSPARQLLFSREGGKPLGRDTDPAWFVMRCSLPSRRPQTPDLYTLRL